MSVEDGFLEALDDYGEEEMTLYSGWRRKQGERTQRKHQATIDEFLGKGRRTTSAGIVARYYAELLTWALHRHIEREKWTVICVLGYHASEPVYIDISTDYDKCENLLMNGRLLIRRGNTHFVVTLHVESCWRGSVQVEGLAVAENKIRAFIDGVTTIVKEENFYRGKKLEFAGRIRFLKVKDKSWDSIILDPAMKKEIRANTIDFLMKEKLWAEYGIPQKRGVMLAGEPGTGKTLICKALMAEADGITCITTNGYALTDDDYITDLYELAQDLSPSIVFIEDIDLIGLNREEYHYQQGPALLALLAVLDGVEEEQEIVTVATTNNLETLDKALSQRPSRFDRVIKLSLPSREERSKLVKLLCKEIPMDELIQDYVACKTEHCTPAQLQEIVYSLVIEYTSELSDTLLPRLRLSKDDIDKAISKVNSRNRQRMGFDLQSNHNDGKLAHL